MPSWPGGTPSRTPRGPRAAGQGPPAQYDSFNASLLYCGTCKQATPTRQRLLLVLPSGNLYEYLCAHCGSSTGSKTEADRSEPLMLEP